MGAVPQYGKPQPQLQQPHGKLDRRARLQTAYGQETPKRGKDETEDKNANRIDGLVLAGRNLRAAGDYPHADIVLRHEPVDGKIGVLLVRLAQLVEHVEREDPALVLHADIVLGCRPVDLEVGPAGMIAREAGQGIGRKARLGSRFAFP